MQMLKTLSKDQSRGYCTIWTAGLHFFRARMHFVAHSAQEWAKRSHTNGLSMLLVILGVVV